MEIAITLLKKEGLNITKQEVDDYISSKVEQQQTKMAAQARACTVVQSTGSRP
jgi:hypothetical protein